MPIHTRRRPNLRLTAHVAAAVIAVAGLATSPVAKAAPTSVPTGPWVSIAGVHGSSPPVEFTAGAYPHTGVSIVSQRDGDDAILCTASWPVIGWDNHTGYLTAGHCQIGDQTPLWMFTGTRGDEQLALSPLQDGEQGIDRSGIAYDSAVFFLSSGPSVGTFDTAIAPGVFLRGVLSVRATRRLPRGTTMCMNGSRSSITCGPLIDAGDAEVEWGGSAVKGDSGAPVFVVDANRQAMAVGILAHGSSDTDNFVTYLAPSLSRLGLRVIINGER